MANPYQALVNQKLVHARFCFSQYQIEGLETQYREALWEAAVVHLATAFRAYCRELALSFNASVEDIYGVEDLQLAADKHGSVDQRVGELLRQGWLESLLRAEREIINPTAQIKAQPTNLLATDSGESKKMEAGDLTTTLSQLEELINRHRAAQVEY